MTTLLRINGPGDAFVLAKNHYRSAQLYPGMMKRLRENTAIHSILQWILQWIAAFIATEKKILWFLAKHRFTDFNIWLWTLGSIKFFFKTEKNKTFRIDFISRGNWKGIQEAATQDEHARPLCELQLLDFTLKIPQTWGSSQGHRKVTSEWHQVHDSSGLVNNLVSKQTEAGREPDQIFLTATSITSRSTWWWGGASTKRRKSPV